MLKKIAMSDIKTIKSAALKELIDKTFPSNKRANGVTDSDYAYLDLEWVENDAYEGYKNWLSIFDFGRSVKNSDWKRNFDCEDLANSFKIYLRLLHAEANPSTMMEELSGKKNESSSESVLVGTIFFNNSKSSAHSINVFFDANDRPKFFEPMYGKFINLTKDERESVWYVEF